MQSSAMNDVWRIVVGQIPLAQVGFTITLSGVTLLLIFLALGAYVGWNQGVRAVLTMTIASVAGYVTCVSGGDALVGIINRFWSNFPALIAFLIGNNPDTAPTLDPLISAELQVPLFFRFSLFVALALLGWFFTKRSPWNGGVSKNEPLARPLGLFAGAMVALLWTSAAAVFYQEYLINGGTPIEIFSSVLGVLPDVRSLIPSLITVFFLIIGGILLLNLPRLVKAT